MRNRALFDIWNEMARLPYGSQGRNGTKGDYVELLLNGRYHGLYCLSDKIDRKLLDLKKSTADRTRGLLYKCTTWGGASGLSFYEEAAMDTVVWNAWELKHPEDYPSESVWQPLADLVDFCRDDLLRRERERWNGNPVELPEEPGEEIDYMMDWYARNCRQMQSLLPVPTGIGPLRTTEAGKREIFGLDGRRMPAAPSHGFYIEDGKKRVR